MIGYAKLYIMLPFRHPFTTIVSGQMGSGKMQFVMRLVDSADTMIEPTPCKIVYYFVEYQPLFEHYEDRIEFHHGMPKADAIDRLIDALVGYDDLMDEADERLTRIFMRKLHHRNVSVIFMVQNFFNKNRHMRTIILNAQYIVLFKNPHESSQFVHLALRTKHTSMPRSVHMATFCWTSEATRTTTCI